MHACPACTASALHLQRTDAAGVGGGEFNYECNECGYKWTTVEVPEPYLRELIARSLELAALKSKT